MPSPTAPYAAGTVSSVSGTTLNISGGAAAGWVGRCIVITSGPAKGQIRQILSFVSATQITVNYAWTISPDPDFTEVEPVAGDGFAISYDLDDLDDGVTLIKDPGVQSYRFVGASDFSGGVFLYAANARIDFTSSSITCNEPTEGARVRLRFGDIDQYGNVYNGCHIVDAATAPSGFGAGSNGTFDPDLHVYGGVLRFTGSGPFWRFHSDNAEIVRMIGVQVNGNMGGRLQGADSILKNLTVYGMNSVNGPFNPKASFGKIDGINVSNSLQAFYHYWTDSMTLKVRGIRPDGTCQRLVRFANTTVSGQMLTMVDNDIAVLQSLPNLYNNANGTYSNTFRLSQELDAQYVNVAGVAVTDPTRIVVRDNVPTTVYNDVVTTGVLPRQELRYRDMTILAVGSIPWASAGGTTYAPYAVAAISYLYQPATLPLPLLKSQAVNLVALADSYISQTNRATVDAYATIDTLDRLYDRAKAWSVDNLAAANPSFGAQLAVGNGTELDLGAFDLVVDATAAQAFSVSGNTITIKASALVAGAKFATFRTTGTLTLSNGATVGVSYTTGAGSFAAISVTGLVAGSRIQLYNLTDSVELANLTVAATGYSAIFPWPGVRTVRLRVSKMGLQDFEATGQFLSSGVSFVSSTPADSVYVANGIDGSAVTEFAADYPNVQVDINDMDGETTVPRLYAWFHAICETEGGIRNFFGGMVAEDTANYRIVTAILNLKLDNVGGSPVILSGARLYRDDGVTVIGGGIIQIDPLKAYTAGLGAAQSSLDRIEANTGLIPALL
jgi:hypothetical protein